MTAHPLFRRLAEDAGTATWTAIDTHGDRTELGIQELGGAGPRGVTEWDGLLRPFPLDRPVPGGTVAIEVTSDGDLQLDALMLLPAVTAAVYSTTGKDVILRAGTADGEITVPVVAGETGRAYRPDGTGGRPFNRGRRALAEGAFAITDR
ncbi:MAG: hypothetical protein Q4G40_00025 [Brachybacterium sp.]|nr:hypothetical protein [Brachybacterium sp.]